MYSGREHLLVCSQNFFVLCSIFLFCLKHLFFVCCKGVRWMPWHVIPMKDVVACDSPRGVGERAVIRGFLNGGTWLELCLVTCL